MNARTQIGRRGPSPALLAAAALAVVALGVLIFSFLRREADKTDQRTRVTPGTTAGRSATVAPGIPNFEPVISTLAGTGARGYQDGRREIAIFNRPSDAVLDAKGNLLIADAGNDMIRAISKEGVVSVFAGTGEKGFTEGEPKTAKFNNPTGIAIDREGNLYVADAGNDQIRKVSTDGVVTKVAGGERGFADGTKGTAKFNSPTALAFAANGDLYVADTGNDLIRKIDKDGKVTVVAGSEKGYADGKREAAHFNAPSGLAFGSDGSLYVADTGNDLIRKISPDGAVTSFAGAQERGYTDGSLRDARFNAPSGLLFDGAGALFVADTGNDLVRRIGPDGTVTTFAGAGEKGFFDGAGRAAQFNAPTRLLLSHSRDLLIVDSGNNMVRSAGFSNAVVTLAGSGARGFLNGSRKVAQFNRASGMIADSAGNLYVADAGNDQIRLVTANGDVITFAGAGEKGYVNGPLTAARFNNPQGIAFDVFGNLVVADSGNDLVRLISTDGTVSTLAGTGERGWREGRANEARFNSPAAVAADLDGNIYVADTGNDAIRVIRANGQVETLAGGGERGYANGAGKQARFNNPQGIAVDGKGNVYVADTGNDVIRVIRTNGQVETLAGTTRGFKDGRGSEAQLNAPARLAMDLGDVLYVAEAGNDVVRKIILDKDNVNMVSVYAGTGERGFAEGEPLKSQFNTPLGIAVNFTGDVFISDTGNGKIRKILPGKK